MHEAPCVYLPLPGVLTYPHSPDYRPDIDGLPPVQVSFPNSNSVRTNRLQSIVMDTIKDIDLSVPGAPSLVMRDLSEYSTLPFLAAFDVIPPSNSTGPGSSNATPPKRVTYIALAKRTMPLLVELYQRFKATPAIYTDGTVEAVLSVRFFLPFNLLTFIRAVCSRTRYPSNSNTSALLRPSLGTTFLFGRPRRRPSCSSSKNVPNRYIT